MRFVFCEKILFSPSIWDVTVRQIERFTSLKWEFDLFPRFQFCEMFLNAGQCGSLNGCMPHDGLWQKTHQYLPHNLFQFRDRETFFVSSFCHQDKIRSTLTKDYWKIEFSLRVFGKKECWRNWQKPFCFLEKQFVPLNVFWKIKNF